MSKILFFYPVYPSFVESDDRILQLAYKVRRFHFNAQRKALVPIYFLNQLVFLLSYTFSAKGFVIHFSGYHSFLPALFGRIFRKPCLIILNGTECHNFPEYNYGYLRKPVLFWFSSKSLQWATLLLPVSESLVRSEYTYARTKYPLQGFRNFYSNLTTPHKVIYNGVDPLLFLIDTANERLPSSFITIASDFGSSSRRLIKGLDLIIELARVTPENTYTFVGATEVGDMDLPSNVTVSGFIPNDQLHALYNRHAFYLQLSASEGFGIALCEAMLCGCVPIVSNVGILPVIAGDDGYVLKTKDLGELVDLITTAQKKYDPGMVLHYRDHIVKHFTLHIRKEKLLHVVEAHIKA
jgi:glycosyltransferase involved in cell wall biosynthesis